MMMYTAMSCTPSSQCEVASLVALLQWITERVRARALREGQMQRESRQGTAGEGHMAL